jgi:Short C-terminal domain
LVQELAELPKVSDVQKKLEKLKDLFKQGLINESEYELKRKELLKKL